MEDRKRSAPDDNVTPRLKRQAVAVNGAPAKVEDDLPRDEDLDRFTKDAILRQMKEYKREKYTLEQQLAHANKESAYHDDHLRVIDGWLFQLLDEVSLLFQHTPHSSDSGRLEFSSSLLSAEPHKFNEHLGRRSEEIRTAIKTIFASAPKYTPDVKKLQEKLSTLLANEKIHSAELQRAMAHCTALDERLLTATSRYMTAEKQLDRAKSAQVAKLEAQAIASSRPEAAGQKTETNGSNDSLEHGPALEAVEIARKEALVISDKQKEQLEKLAEENKNLTEELTAAQIKSRTINDDDYAASELFKHIKSQHADVIKRINDLEARNIELRDEAKVLQAERTEYRDKVDNEFRDQDVAMQTEIAQKDADLTRVRAQRDEMTADLAVRKSTAEAYKESHDKFKELAEARQLRISALELEVDRLRLGEQDSSTAANDMSTDAAQLQSKLKLLEQEKATLEQELKSMEAAYKKMSSMAALKVNDLLHHEDRMRLCFEEKVKADQKYFSARKLLDSREAQFKDMQKQVSRSSEIISTFKEAESNCRASLINAEKQLAERKDLLQQAEHQNRLLQSGVSDYKATSDRLTTQAEEFKKLLTAKDELAQSAKKAQREAELIAEELKTTVARTAKEVQVWKDKARGNQSEDMLSLKKLLYCTVCDQNIKDTVIKNCRHVMCRECVERQITARARRCPICATPYGQQDHMQIQL